MNKKTWLYLLPFIIFLLGALFLFKGLYSDPTKLESVMVDKEVPVFTLQDIYDLGKQHDRSILKGRPMLLNVWATWCPTCYGEHTYLKELAGQGIYIVGMNYKDTREDALPWLKRNGDPFAFSIYDDKGRISIDYGVYGVPETYVIDAKGVIRFKHIGPLTPEVQKKKIEPLLKELSRGG